MALIGNIYNNNNSSNKLDVFPCNKLLNNSII